MAKENEEKIKKKLKGIKKNIMSPKDIGERLQKKTEKKNEEEKSEE